jgi:hypothetical protein
LPVKVAPACTKIVSPGRAALIRACKSPPAFTVALSASMSEPTNIAYTISVPATVCLRLIYACLMRQKRIASV